jgi:hypothetical protein
MIVRLQLGGVVGVVVRLDRVLRVVVGVTVIGSGSGSDLDADGAVLTVAWWMHVLMDVRVRVLVDVLVRVFLAAVAVRVAMAVTMRVAVGMAVSVAGDHRGSPCGGCPISPQYATGAGEGGGVVGGRGGTRVRQRVFARSLPAPKCGNTEAG